MIFAVFLLLLIPVNAHAYLDPGTGSFIIQVIIATVASAFVIAKIYWIKVKNVLLFLPKKIFRSKGHKNDNSR